ncbi:hypothetical protein C8R44DRAFT_756986 [Mycena epipterygia]|nr:hypothetical protein C8R44DRAFT_756986 [Mycena epipterygia]
MHTTFRQPPHFEETPKNRRLHILKAPRSQASRPRSLNPSVLFYTARYCLPGCRALRSLFAGWLHRARGGPPVTRASADSPPGSNFLR